jgi:Zn-dependent peptidase ImmA (M78 family)
VNADGKHSRSAAGRRATLAHEICHLLIDRQVGLPFAEVLGGRVRDDIEQRAGAFAAELLLPRAVAANRLMGSKNPTEDAAALAREFQVSREVVAWQVHNAADRPGPDVLEALRPWVRQQWKFGRRGEWLA